MPHGPPFSHSRSETSSADGQPKPVSVSELTAHIKGVLEETFPPMWVSGEISSLARPRSGHLYFTLKDNHAQIRGVIWRSVASRLKFDLEDGQAVLCYGNVDVYAARGSYQLIVRKIEPQGLGALQLAFQQLQAKLDSEGLFAAQRKQPLPRFPQRIGIVTSPSGAAVRDFLKAASNRWKGVEIIVIPAQVQGQGAAGSIVNALQAAHRMQPALDLVVLSRGGGSLEDLWCFNEEPVVRAVAASRLPTVSAVGHEIDVTLSDLAADVRALTPTDAATRVLPDGESLEQSVTMLRCRLDQSIRRGIRDRRQRLESLSQRTGMRHPFEIVHSRWRLLDELDARARQAAHAQLAAGRNRIQTAAASLSALSPLSVLARGYSVTFDAEGNPLRTGDAVVPGEKIRTRLHQGEIDSVVQDTRHGE